MKTTFTTFEELKNHLSDLCISKKACEPEYKRLMEAINERELLQVLFDNMNWCVKNILTGNQLKEWFGAELCNSMNIYFEGHSEIKDATSVHFNSATSKHYGSATSEHYGSATSEHYDSATSKHYDSATSEHYDSATSKHYDSATSVHFNSATSKHYGSATSVHYGSATSVHFNSATFYCRNIDKHSINDLSLGRIIDTNRIYIKKDAFEIVYVD